MSESKKNTVLLNNFGFYELINKPNKTELNEYYSKKYFSGDKGSYSKQYSDEELLYFNNKISEKYFVINNHLTKSNENRLLLDIGCGEGFTLQYFKNKDWTVTGLDYSVEGCSYHNPGCLENIIVGDIYESIDKLINENKSYHIVWLDNVLEHVLDPLNLLIKIQRLIKVNGLFVIEVPNDFSLLQTYLLNKQYIHSEFWVVYPDHISYFNRNGLITIAKRAGWEPVYMMTDSVIDFNLLNESSNYILDKSKGKLCHKARVEMDNLLHTISLEKTVNYYHSIAELGLGRQIIGFFKKV
jgi:2-polyprenyl-3-methyl-5-hydroxy-6-metoxy-1,4-benzoquinol methylase